MHLKWAVRSLCFLHLLGIDACLRLSIRFVTPYLDTRSTFCARIGINTVCFILVHSLIPSLSLFLPLSVPIPVNGGTAFMGRAVTAPSAGSTRTAAPPRSELSMMRHRKGFKTLGKPADQRKALLRALTTEVIRHGRIKTTLVRAKAVRKHVDHVIELGKRGDLHARRQAMAWVYDKQLVHALFEAAPDRYGDQNGGYTRVLRTVPRQGDNAKMAVIELV